jgi:hypothetical protein
MTPRAPCIPRLLPLVLLAAWTTSAHGGEADGPALPPLPEGATGIAARHPGDAGIAADPAVVFADDFEDAADPADLRKKWSSVFGDQSLRLTTAAADVHGGRTALELVMPKQATPQSSGLHQVLKREVDTLFLRFYSRFEAGFDYPLEVSCHNGVDISARYYANGASPGKRADGSNKFLAAFEDEIGYRGKAPIPGPLDVYIYHPEQRSDYGDHFFPTGMVLPYSPKLGNNGEFGKDFKSRPDVIPELGRWYCYEFMVQANAPGRRDGRIGCWLDGRVIADFPNLRLRDIATLRIERIGLGIYMAANSIRENRKWYDDVVAATAYIGPRVAVDGADKR